MPGGAAGHWRAVIAVRQMEAIANSEDALIALVGRCVRGVAFAIGDKPRGRFARYTDVRVADLGLGRAGWQGHALEESFDLIVNAPPHGRWIGDRLRTLLTDEVALCYQNAGILLHPDTQYRLRAVLFRIETSDRLAPGWRQEAIDKLGAGATLTSTRGCDPVVLADVIPRLRTPPPGSRTLKGTRSEPELPLGVPASIAGLH